MLLKTTIFLKSSCSCIRMENNEKSQLTESLMMFIVHCAAMASQKWDDNKSRKQTHAHTYTHTKKSGSSNNKPNREPNWTTQTNDGKNGFVSKIKASECNIFIFKYMETLTITSIANANSAESASWTRYPSAKFTRKATRTEHLYTSHFALSTNCLIFARLLHLQDMAL